MTPNPPHMAFTVRHTGRVLRLISDVEVFSAFTPGASPTPGKKYQALYDTGATHSAVSPKVVAELRLPSVGARSVGVAGGDLTTTSHMVNITLPNGVMFTMMSVAKTVLPGGIDALIGMDILGIGDFTVTHHGGNTTFSFCCPSRREIDFVAEVTQKAAPAHSNKVSRNSPCPCGSNKKYKKCCGES